MSLTISTSEMGPTLSMFIVTFTTTGGPVNKNNNIIAFDLITVVCILCISWKKIVMKLVLYNLTQDVH